jgi:hypothetical protein
MKTIELPVYLMAKAVARWDAEKRDCVPSVDYFVWPYPTYQGAEVVNETTITFEIQELDPKDLKLKELQEEKRRISAEFQAKVTDIQSQINNLLAIEG